jgi:hypothetical protein
MCKNSYEESLGDAKCQIILGEAGPKFGMEKDFTYSSIEEEHLCIYFS